MHNVKTRNSSHLPIFNAHPANLSSLINFTLLAVAVFSLSACSSSGSSNGTETGTTDTGTTDTGTTDTGTTDTGTTDTGTTDTGTTDTGTTDIGTTDAGGGSNASALSGVWTRCLGVFRQTYTLTATTWDEQMPFFENVNCTGTPQQGLNFGGSYEIVGTGTSEGGLEVLQVNFTSETLDGVAVLESARVTRYNIVYTGTPGQLVFGEFSSSEANRPTQLEFEIPYLRQ